MKAGFFVSFIGTLPLGYLNLIALQLFIVQSWVGLIPFVLGVLLVEYWVIYVTFLGAKKLIEHSKILFWIDVFSVVFMLFLGYAFLQQSSESVINLPAYLQVLPTFFIGVILNGLNFMQLPFWAGWNIFLIDAKWIKVTDFYPFVIGALIGTFLGMCGFVWLSHYFAAHFSPYLFAGLFFILAGVPLWKIVRTKIA